MKQELALTHWNISLLFNINICSYSQATFFVLLSLFLLITAAKFLKSQPTWEDLDHFSGKWAFFNESIRIAKFSFIQMTSYRYLQWSVPLGYWAELNMWVKISIQRNLRTPLLTPSTEQIKSTNYVRSFDAFTVNFLSTPQRKKWQIVLVFLASFCKFYIRNFHNCKNLILNAICMLGRMFNLHLLTDRPVDMVNFLDVADLFIVYKISLEVFDDNDDLPSPSTPHRPCDDDGDGDDGDVHIQHTRTIVHQPFMVRISTYI